MSLTTAPKKLKRQNAAFKHLMAMHWIMAAFIPLLYGTGVGVAHPLQVPLLDSLIPFLHQSLGMLFLMLLIARLFLLLRVIKRKYLSRLPKTTSSWLQTVMLNSSLYVLMLVAPASGFCLRSFAGSDTVFFGIHISSIFAASKDWVELARTSHFWSSYILLAFVFLHVLAHWKVAKIKIRNCLLAVQKVISKVL